MLRSLAAEIGLLGPDDRMAVLAFDGSKVDLLSGWSDSPEELRRALAAAGERRAGGVMRMAELGGHDNPFGRDPGRAGARADVVQELSTEDRFFAQQVAHKVKRSVAGAVAGLRGFAQPPGRKVMLLLTGDWPFSPAGYAANQRAALADGTVKEGRELMQPLIDTANLLGYTIYPVDVPGLQPLGGIGPDIEMADDGTLPTPSSDRERMGEDSLHWIARATGGDALINAERQAPLANVKADTRSYYWLGFTPERQGSDDRHDIEVEVTRPGVRVRSRTSFLDLSRQAEREMAVESLLLFGEGQQAGGLYVEVGEPRRSGRRQVAVPLRIGIPTDFVTLVPNTTGDRWTVRLELRVGALDERRRQSDVPSVPLEITFKERPPAGQLIPYSTELSLRRAEQVLVITVTDAVSGESLGARATFDP